MVIPWNGPLVAATAQQLKNLRPMKKGQTANPKGINAFTKKRKLLDYLDDYFHDDIAIMVNGSKKKLPRAEALAQLIGNYAMRIGDKGVDKLVWKACFEAVMDRIAPIEKGREVPVAFVQVVDPQQLRRDMLDLYCIDCEVLDSQDGNGADHAS